jgi:hypothetical protein
MTIVDEKYQDSITIAVIAAAGLGVPGLFLPTLDMAGMGAIWTTLVLAIASTAGRSVDIATAGKLVTSAVGAVSAYIVGSKILTWAAAPLIFAFPLAGVPAVIAVNAMLNAIFTLRLGIACARRFSTPDFTAGDVLDLAADIAGYLIKLPSREEISFVRAVIGVR